MQGNGTSAESGPDLLADPFPPFLRLLDSDPEEAKRGFTEFVQRFFAEHPPAQLRKVPADQRGGRINEIFAASVRNDFKVLRSYENRQRPFAAFFTTVSANRITDWLKKRWGDDARETGIEKVEQSPEGIDPAANPVDRIYGQQVIDLTQRCLRRLEDACRMLIFASAQKKTGREMALLLGYPEEENKKALDKLRACKKKLTKLLLQHGVDVDGFLGRRTANAHG